MGKVLIILKDPNSLLIQRAEEVGEITTEIKDLVDSMVKTMKANEGIGLAANQVGILKRIIIFRPDLYLSHRVMINPYILDSGGHTLSKEACLSIPGFDSQVLRAVWIIVRFLDLEGNLKEEDFQGEISFIIQHEIDHTNGILYVDKLRRQQRRLYERKYKGTTG